MENKYNINENLIKTKYYFNVEYWKMNIDSIFVQYLYVTWENYTPYPLGHVFTR